MLKNEDLEENNLRNKDPRETVADLRIWTTIYYTNLLKLELYRSRTLITQKNPKKIYIYNY